MHIHHPGRTLFCLFFVVLIQNNKVTLAGPETVAGEIITSYPTIHNIAVEWLIEGDDNENGVVTVHYRKAGESPWREAMPLRRVPAGKSKGTTFIYPNGGNPWYNKHSGSIFDLDPDTEYEIRLTLHDPDGGSEQRTVSERTRPLPTYTTADIYDLPPGQYTVLRTRSGKPDRPRVYRSGDGSAVFRQVDLRNKKWVYIEGLTIRKRGITDSPGIAMAGAENCVVRYCTINATFGITGYSPGIKNCYIADNVISGVNDWTPEAMGAHGRNIGEGIQISGPGNTICYNRVSNFRDCISTMEDSLVDNQISIDIYNNDIYFALDDGIEADFCFNNCRIMRNRLTNCFVGLSSQPSLGGPTYFIRNSMYNIIHGAFKLKRHSRGDVVLHNTVVKVGAGLGGNSSMDYAYFRNNLAIGGPDAYGDWGGYGSGLPSAANIIDPGAHSSFDYDAVGVFGIPFEGWIGSKPFFDVEPHGLRIDLGVFDNVAFPGRPVPGYSPVDLRPRADARVVDAAERIPNINDQFLGGGPDIGAHEAGAELPHYGPRREERTTEEPTGVVRWNAAYR